MNNGKPPEPVLSPELHQLMEKIWEGAKVIVLDPNREVLRYTDYRPMAPVVDEHAAQTRVTVELDKPKQPVIPMSALREPPLLDLRATQLIDVNPSAFAVRST